MKVFKIVAVVLVLLFSGMRGAVSAPVDTIKQKAGILLEHNENQAAIDAYFEALAQDCTDPEIFVGLALAYSKQGDYDRSREYYFSKIRYTPGDDAAFCQLGVRDHINGDFAQAMVNFNKVVELNPFYADAYHSMAQIFSAKGYFELEVDTLKKAWNINPDDTDIFYFSPIEFGRKYNYDQARKFFDTAVRLDANYARIYRERGYHCLRIAEIFKPEIYRQKAVDNFLKYIELNPEDPEIYFQLALLYRDAMNSFEAEKYFRKIVRFRGFANMESVCYNLGELHFAKKDYKQAGQWFMESYAINPNSPHTQLGRGKVFFHLGDYTGAERMLKQLKESTHPEFADELEKLLATAKK